MTFLANFYGIINVTHSFTTQTVLTYCHVSIEFKILWNNSGPHGSNFRYKQVLKGRPCTLVENYGHIILFVSRGNELYSSRTKGMHALSDNWQ